jgi:hypothetical protein
VSHVCRPLAFRLGLGLASLTLCFATVATSAYPSTTVPTPRTYIGTSQDTSTALEPAEQLRSSRPRRACVAIRHRRIKRPKARRSCTHKRSQVTETKPPMSIGRTSTHPSLSPASATPGAVSTPGESSAVSEPFAPGSALTPFRFFSATSAWNEPVPVNAPLDPNSAAAVGFLNEAVAEEEQRGKGPEINTDYYSVPIYTVPADQPVVSVRLTSQPSESVLQSAWSAVPLPPNAQPAAGTDGHLVVWQPSTDRLWEFWRLVKGTEGWHASWGGAMQNVSSNPGVYGPEAWPGATRQWGASASSLSIAGGLITLEDLELGQINHALAIGLPEVRSGVYASPAQRTDGRSINPWALAEGAHLRLDPSLDLATLHLPRLTYLLAEAAQRYGIVVRDGASNVAFYAQDPISTGTEPYAASGGYFEGRLPEQLLASFPWRYLQVLKLRLHRNALR